LDEVFPRLSARGWLETDVTDTTSQALRIQYADPDSAELEEVTVRSWTGQQIKDLMNHPDVGKRNRGDGIEVHFGERDVSIDGTQARLDPDDLAQWRFPRRLPLVPFGADYRVPPEQRGDRAFIRALTVK